MLRPVDCKDIQDKLERRTLAAREEKGFRRRVEPSSAVPGKLARVSPHPTNNKTEPVSSWLLTWQTLTPTKNTHHHTRHGVLCSNRQDVSALRRQARMRRLTLVIRLHPTGMRTTGVSKSFIDHSCATESGHVLAIASANRLNTLTVDCLWSWRASGSSLPHEIAKVSWS
ncbi:hypothetical protein GWK47_035172 [Chionoecetes opilio]|uniref:Uncharacterized protein n=1 Tax=Chionoecetes opilio TaxID=41210 RepID=A0A8J5D2J6_CHIOP|nr:hypothetical protein GWK47_035172 [Chionoecetes opilio]